MSNMIQITHLSKSFGSIKAVQDLSFRVKEGELFAFLGINGAGKSTTINIMCGQLAKDSGSVFIDGRDLDKDMDFIKRELGIVFQSSVLDSALSVYDNLESRAALYGITGTEFKTRLADLAKRLDFENLLKRTVGKLSGGQRRRIDIARALFHKPKILILDEPTTGLDPQTRRILWDVISSFRKNEKMTTSFLLIKRNVKLFFKDKGMFFTSLITPAILLILYVTFLGNVYRDNFTSNLPAALNLSERMIEGLVGGQLISSILAVSCVTVAFCSNFLMVQDKANGTIKDLRISPVKSAALSLSYYMATLISTLIICFAALGICLAYVAIVGWYMSLADVCFLFLDIVLLVLFGTALSSIINFFLSTQGQISAVGTIISAGYGFICGAYMPISSFGEGLQKFISFLPGTYGTSLVRNHTMQGVLAEMQNQGIPANIIEELKDSLDCNLYFFGNRVSTPTMYLILGIAIAVLIGIYILLNQLKKYSN